MPLFSNMNINNGIIMHSKYSMIMLYALFSILKLIFNKFNKIPKACKASINKYVVSFFLTSLKNSIYKNSINAVIVNII